MNTKGIPVLDLIPGCHAERAGVRTGDRLLIVNGIKTNNMDDYVEACAKDLNHTRTVVVLRDGVELEFQMIIGTPIGINFSN